jgi:PKD repeat protein
MREESTMRRVAGFLAVALAATVLTVVPHSGVEAAVPTFPSVPIASWRLNGEGYAVLKVGNVVYVGGSFSTARSANGGSSASRANLAAFDATTGELVSGFRADTNGTVRDIQTDGTSIFVAGTFTTVGGVSRSRVAALDPGTGAVRTAFRADTNGTVRNLSLGGGKLYVGGAYTTIGGVSRTRAAAVSPTTGAVDAGFVPNIDGSVYSIAATPDGSRAYVGGPFTTVNGGALADLAVLDGSSGATAAVQLSDVVGFTDELEVSPDGTRLVAGHSGIPGVGNRTQVYDTTSGARTWRQSVDGDVQGVHLVGDTVYSGFHDGVDGDGSTRMVANSLSGGTRDTAFRPVFDRFMGVRAVGGDNEALVIAGDFSTVSGRSVEGFAIFRAGAPTPFAGSAWGYESWRYRDDGTDQGAAWQAHGFDDSAWKAGSPKFGFGVNEIDTSISYGSSSSNKYVTTYFRKTVNLTSTPAAAALYARVDDGAVVYVNGIEANRDNMPTGPIGSATFAASDRSRSSGDNSRYLAIDPALLHAGSNTIAVEVHLASRSASSMQYFPTFVAYADGPPNQAPVASFTTSPVTGEAPLAVGVDGTASTDADGTIGSWAWNFGNGTTGTGPTSSTTYTTAGTYTVTLTVTDDDGATNTTTRSVVVTSTPVDPPPGPPLSVPRSATWRYLDNGTDQGTAWRDLGHDDSAWKSGVGEFGYGDGDETTVVSYGPSSGSKYPTTYFRHVFTATAVPATLTFSMRLDDGAVVYLNGTEVARYNMGTGTVAYTTRAPAALSGSGETLDRQFSIDPNLVTPGANVIAVEVHQNTLGSSDLSFWGDLTST